MRTSWLVLRAHLLASLVLLAASLTVFFSCDDNRSQVYPGGTVTTAPLTNLGVGEPCSSTDECRYGLACVDGTCQPGHSSGEGAPCLISAECQDGLWCSDGHCAPGGAGMDGDACLSDADCASGFRCAMVGLSAVCVPDGNVDVGGACMLTTECFAPLLCIDGTCQVPPEGSTPFGIPWPGVDCEMETGPPTAHFHIPRGDASDKDFFRLPYPNDVRLAGGSLDLDGFPTPGPSLLGFDLVKRYLDAVVAERDGWSMYGSIYFRFSAPIDFGTLANQVLLINLTDDQSMPLYWSYTSGRGAYICPNRIAVNSAMGWTFEPAKSYAAVLLDGIQAEGGGPVARAPDLEAMLWGTVPSDATVAPHWPKYQALRDYFTNHSIDPATVLDATVFTVGHPRAAVEQLQTVIDAAPPPAASQWTLCDTNVTSPCPDATGPRACGAADPDFWELHALVALPIFQRGNAPYFDPADGGALEVVGGVPTVVRTEQVCMSLSVPKAAMPPGGWGTLVYAHGTGGHFRTHIAEGTAKAFAQGVGDGLGNTVVAAVLGIDQAQHGPRRGASTSSPNDLFYNFANPAAALGNPQQGAADQAALLRFAPSVNLAAAASPTGQPLQLSSTVAFWGHSQGAMAGSMAVPYGNWTGALFTGLGASLRDSLVTKTSPVDIAAVMPLVLSDATSDGKLQHGSRNPALNLMQHFIDGGDPVAYGQLITVMPPTGVAAHHAFQIYGSGDTYTPRETQITYALAARLGLVAADASVATPDDLGGLMAVAPPASGNLTVNAKTVTAYVRQYAPFGSDDGHFVAFDVANANADARRFVAGLLSGVVPQVGQ